MTPFAIMIASWVFLLFVLAAIIIPPVYWFIRYCKAEKFSYKGYGIYSLPTYVRSKKGYSMSGYVRPQVAAFKTDNNIVYPNKNLAHIAFQDVVKNEIDKSNYPKPLTFNEKCKEKIELYTAFLIFAPIAGFFYATFIYLLRDVLFWLKFGFWHVTTFQDSLVDLKIIDKSYYVNFPDYLGVEKIFTWLLNLSASGAYFFLAMLYIFILMFIFNLVVKKN